MSDRLTCSAGHGRAQERPGRRMFPSLVGAPGSGNRGCERWAGVRPRPRPRRARNWRAAPAPRPSHVPHVSVRRPRWGSTGRGTRGRGRQRLLQPPPRGSQWGWGNWVFLRAASAPGSARRVLSCLLFSPKSLDSSLLEGTSVLLSSS